MNKKLIWGIVIVVVVIAGLWLVGTLTGIEVPIGTKEYSRQPIEKPDILDLEAKYPMLKNDAYAQTQPTTLSSAKAKECEGNVIPYSSGNEWDIRVVLCGSSYFISDITAKQEKLYGPFIPKTDNNPVASQTPVVANKNVQPSLIIVSPNGGEVWKIGSEQTVKWELKGTFPASYRVGLYLGGAFLGNLDTTVSSRTLTVPSQVFVGSDNSTALKPGKYKINVHLYDGPINLGNGVPGGTWGKVILEDSSDAEITITN